MCTNCPKKSGFLSDASNPVGATLFEHKDYAGKSMNIHPDDVLKGKRATPGNFIMGNDAVSSIRLMPGYKITVYEHDNFRGDFRTFSTSVANLHPIGWGDKISSVIVERLPVAQEPQPDREQEETYYDPVIPSRESHFLFQEDTNLQNVSRSDIVRQQEQEQKQMQAVLKKTTTTSGSGSTGSSGSTGGTTTTSGSGSNTQSATTTDTVKINPTTNMVLLAGGLFIGYKLLKKVGIL